MIRRTALVALTTTALACAAGAQTPIPVRQLTAPEATSVDTVGPQVRAWQWADGRVVVGSVRSGRLLLMDQSLATSRVLTDSAMVNPGSTPIRSLLAFPLVGSDSTAVLDIGNSSVVVMDQSGKQARVVALPHARDASLISTSGMVPIAMDLDKRVVYRGTYPGAPAMPGHTAITPSDSMPLVRVNFDARSVDTLAVLNVRPVIRTATTTSLDGTVSRTALINPMRPLDDWTMTSDGSLAIVRGHDYHIDWIYPDGRRAATPKMPFDWRRVSDAEKQGLIDSLKTVYGQMDHLMDSIAAARGAKSLTASAPARIYAPLSEIADYVIPIRVSSVFADADNHVWILPATSAQARGGLLYDVVNHQGEIVERVQLPAGAVLAGFGTDGVVLLSVTSPRGAHLVRTRIQH